MFKKYFALPTVLLAVFIIMLLLYRQCFYPNYRLSDKSVDTYNSDALNGTVWSTDDDNVNLNFTDDKFDLINFKGIVYGKEVTGSVHIPSKSVEIYNADCSYRYSLLGFVEFSKESIIIKVKTSYTDSVPVGTELVLFNRS